MKEWKSGLFCLHHHWQSSFCAIFFPGSCLIMHICANYSINDCCMGTLRCLFIPWIGCALNRGNLRNKYNIDGDIWSDLLAWFYCPVCAGTQEFREIYQRERKKRVKEINETKETRKLSKKKK